jgi:outer membrane protein OmpA-like peptidoglycan-associated protein
LISANLKTAALSAFVGGLVSVSLSAPVQAESYVPGIWTDPDGCEHWVMDDGLEGFMTPNVTPNGKPVCKRGNTCLIAGSDQLFAVDSAVISSTGRTNLEDFFSKKTTYGYVIEGHTDSDASDAYNLSLAKRRAAAVEKIARAAGAQSVEVRSYGERKPRATNSTKAGKRLNRRVEIQCVARPGGKS